MPAQNWDPRSSMNEKYRVPISIGVPVLNGENYLALMLESLLSQSFADFELIVSDNASTDRTESICREYAARDRRIRYIRNDTNKGAAWNFNNTFHNANGKYFKWAAHDDLHGDSFLEACYNHLESNQECVLCFTGTQFIDATGNNLGNYQYPIDIGSASRSRRLLHFASCGHIVHEIFGLIRRDILEQTSLIRGFVGSDVTLLAQLALFGPFYQVPEPLFFHREHDARSVKAMGTGTQFAAWFDPRNTGQYVFPAWRRLRENVGDVLAHPMGMGEKAKCLKEVARAGYWRRGPLLREILSAARIFLRSATSRPGANR